MRRRRYSEKSNNTWNLSITAPQRPDIRRGGIGGIGLLNNRMADSYFGGIKYSPFPMQTQIPIPPDVKVPTKPNPERLQVVKEENTTIPVGFGLFDTKNYVVKSNIKLKVFLLMYSRDAFLNRPPPAAVEQPEAPVVHGKALRRRRSGNTRKVEGLPEAIQKVIADQTIEASTFKIYYDEEYEDDNGQVVGGWYADKVVEDSEGYILEAYPTVAALLADPKATLKRPNSVSYDENAPHLEKVGEDEIVVKKESLKQLQDGLKVFNEAVGQNANSKALLKKFEAIDKAKDLQEFVKFMPDLDKDIVVPKNPENLGPLDRNILRKKILLRMETIEKQKKKVNSYLKDFVTFNRGASSWQRLKTARIFGKGFAELYRTIQPTEDLKSEDGKLLADSLAVQTRRLEMLKDKLDLLDGVGRKTTASLINMIVKSQRRRGIG